MLPLKAFVNALQNTLRYPDCCVRAFPFLDGRLEHHHAGLVLEKPPDRFDVELPEFPHFGRCVMPFDWSRIFHRIARIVKWGGHRCLVRNHAVLACGSETCPQAFESGGRVSSWTLLSLFSRRTRWSIMEALGLSIHVRDVPGSPLVAMPHAEEFDNVPAPFRAWNADSLAQTQVSTRSVAK